MDSRTEQLRLDESRHRRRRARQVISDLVATLSANVRNSATTQFLCGNVVKNRTLQQYLVAADVKNSAGTGFTVFS